jgi:hypothetical protein
VTALDNRPTLTYPGDTTSTVGQVVGPTLAGEWLVIDDVTFDAEAGKSRAHLRYATEAEVEAAHR